MTQIWLLQEWKDRKRLQRRVIAGKKVLSEMDQVHVLEGLVSGDKIQKASLAEQIGSIDFQLFRHAVHCASKQIERYRPLFDILPKFSSKETEQYVYLLYTHVALPRCQIANHSLFAFGGRTAFSH